jgi:hypothetical protein
LSVQAVSVGYDGNVAAVDMLSGEVLWTKSPVRTH